MFGANRKRIDRLELALAQLATQQQESLKKLGEIGSAPKQEGVENALAAILGENARALPAMCEQFGRLCTTMADMAARNSLSGKRSVAGRKGGQTKQTQAKYAQELENMAAACVECADQIKGIPWADRQPTDKEVEQRHAKEHEAKINKLLREITRGNGGVQLTMGGANAQSNP